ncbi:hypothetical protein SADUNF_Sadunf16G0100500 [Salix dunnii]|uniref:Uncharacterized protein n=1 Tax=Salix dunnii TaxID=1413687 RepID=A0A835MGJ3_9ROSI|nr:hypothetical protein SADUNF_Sadunf16G0100500 [Salix dunnii]
MNGGGFWWDLPIDNMEQDELEAYKELMEELKKNLIARLGLIESTCNAFSDACDWTMGCYLQFYVQGKFDSLHQELLASTNNAWYNVVPSSNLPPIFLVNFLP